MWWSLYLFYLGFESELKYYLPHVNWVLASISFCITLILLVVWDKMTSKKLSVLYVITASAYLTFILCVTLYGRTPIGSSSCDTLFITYQNALNDVPGAGSSIFYNMVLFFPLGLLTVRYRHTRRCIIFLLGFSALIELTQLITSLGVFEISDIINNFLGGLIGLGFARFTAMLFNFTKQRIDRRKGRTVERTE